MLTKNQIDEIDKREKICPNEDVRLLLNYLQEIEHLLCEHQWIYTYDDNFTCTKCMAKKQN